MSTGGQPGPRSSAIGFPIPELDPLVGAWRAEHDPSAAQGVGAHITLLVPFKPPHLITEDVIEELVSFFGRQKVPVLEFAGVCGFREAIYLRPEPQGPLNEIIQRLAGLYPETPPYEGRIPVAGIVPHVTVAYSESPGELALISDAFCRASIGRLPIRTRIREALLITQDDAGSRATRAVLPLRA